MTIQPGMQVMPVTLVDASGNPVTPGGGTVTSVTAANASVTVTGTSAAPTIATGTLDVIAAQEPPAAAVTMNSQKLTGLANGSAATDSAAYGQTLGGGNLAPLTTAGDLLIASSTPAPARLAVGSGTQFLGVSGGLPAWAALPAASTSASGIVELDGTAADIAAPGTQAQGTGSLAAISTHVHPENSGWIASDQGFKAWNYDLALVSVPTFSSQPAAGTIYLARVNIRAPVTIAGDIAIWWIAPSGGSPANSYLGLYTSAGAQVGSATSDFTATSSGVISKSIGGSQNLSAGYYYVAFLIGTQGSTKGGAVTTNSNTITGGGGMASTGLSAAGYRWATNGTSASALPTGSSAFTLSSNAATPYSFWCALL